MLATIRQLRRTDMEGLIGMYLDLYDERRENVGIGITLFRDPPTHEAEVGWFADLFRRNLSGSALTRVADVDGRPVGSCTVTPVGMGPGSEQGHLGMASWSIGRTAGAGSAER